MTKKKHTKEPELTEKDFEGQETRERIRLFPGDGMVTVETIVRVYPHATIPWSVLIAHTRIDDTEDCEGTATCEFLGCTWYVDCRTDVEAERLDAVWEAADDVADQLRKEGFAISDRVHMRPREQARLNRKNRNEAIQE